MWGTLWWLFLAAVVFVLGSFALKTQGSQPEQGSTQGAHGDGQHSRTNGSAQQDSSQQGGGSWWGWKSDASGKKPSAGAGAGGSSSSRSVPQGDEDEAQHEEEDGYASARLKPVAHQYPGCTGEVARILDARDHYSVLEVARDVSSEEIKKAFRRKAMAAHPDKNQGVVGALPASQRVNEAYEHLSNEVKRRQYDVKLQDEEENGPRRRGAGGRPNWATYEDQARAFDEFVRQHMEPPPPGAHYPTIDPSAYDPHSDAPDHSFRMACQCGYDHMATKVPGRHSWNARQCNCSHCGWGGSRLPAKDNDVWFESSSFLRAFNPEEHTRALRCVGTYVYDITPWAKCNGMLMDVNGTPAPVNTHYVPFRLAGAGSGKGAKQKSEKKDAGYGYNQFKGGGNNSHKRKNNNKKKKRNW